MIPGIWPGEEVTVLRPVEAGRDELNAPIAEWAEEPVPGVLPAPATTADAVSSIRPEGDVTAMSVYFPSSYMAALRGCLIRWEGKLWKVAGDPIPYRSSLVPGPWNRVAEAMLEEG